MRSVFILFVCCVCVGGGTSPAVGGKPALCSPVLDVCWLWWWLSWLYLPVVWTMSSTSPPPRWLAVCSLYQVPCYKKPTLLFEYKFLNSLSQIRPDIESHRGVTPKTFTKTRFTEYNKIWWTTTFWLMKLTVKIHMCIELR